MEANELKRRKEECLAAIKSKYGTAGDEYDVTLFISHHIKEIKPEYWEKHLGATKPEPRDVLNILELHLHWDDDRIFDFTLPENVTNYLISVKFNEAGTIKEISMES